jgi:hypothetical protein
VLIPSELTLKIDPCSFLVPERVVFRFASALSQNFSNPSDALSVPNHSALASGIHENLHENPVPIITCASFACLPKRSRQRFLKMIHTFTKDLFIREKVWSKMNDYERVLLKLIAKEICMQPTLIRFESCPAC